jgi:hypothetical protein
MGKIPGTFILAALSLLFCNGLISFAYGHSLVFGPELFSSEGGKSQRVVKRFSVHDVSQKFIVSVQNGKDGGQGAGRGAVKMNGKTIFSSAELGKQFKMLTKPVKLQKKNVVSVEWASDAPIILTIMSLKEQTVTTKIPPLGDKVILKEYATIEFPAGAFDGTQDVRMSITTSLSKQNIFEADATGPRLPYEIRINTGNKAPKTDITVSLKYPDSFFASHYQMHIFAQMHDNPDAPGVHDRFVMIDTGLDDHIEMAMTTLPKYAFSNRYGKNGTYEAIITVGLIH